MQNIIFKSKLEKEYRYNWIILLIFGIFFLLIALGALFAPMPNLLGNILLGSIFSSLSVLFIWFSLQLMATYLIIYENGARIRKPFRLLRSQFISWESIEKMRLYTDFRLKMEIFIKNQSKTLSVNKAWVDEIENAYDIMKKCIEPLGGACESIFDFHRCIYCGADIKIIEDLKFCPKCGNDINTKLMIEKFSNVSSRRHSLTCPHCEKFYTISKMIYRNQKLILILKCPSHYLDLMLLPGEITPDDIPQKMYRIVAGNIKRCQKCGTETIFRKLKNKKDDCLLFFECPTHRAQKALISSVFFPKIEEIWERSSEITDIEQL